MTDPVIQRNPATSTPRQEGIAQAIEAARQAAERARLAAEQARAAATVARLAADKSRRAAEPAKARHGDKPADAADPARLKTRVLTDESNALKLEATATLKEKRKALADARLGDAEQGRGAGNPSSKTVAAEAEVRTASENAALYDDDGPGTKSHKGPHHDPSPLSEAQKETKALLKKAEAAGKTVFEAKKPSQAQKDALNAAVNAWLQSAQRDIRIAGVTAEAKGKDPAAAMKAEARALMDKVESGDVFNAKALGEFVDSGPADPKKGRPDILHSVLAESPERRRLLVDRHEAERIGADALGDARAAAKKARLDAAEAQEVADTHHGGGYVEDAMQAGAAEKARLAAEAKAKVKALETVYGTRKKLGTIPAGFNVRGADLDVVDASRRFEASGSRADGKALDHAIANQKIAHAQSAGLAALQDQHDANKAQATAQSAYDAAKASQPQPRTVTSNSRGESKTEVVLPDGYDRTFDATPGSADAENVHQGLDGKYYLSVGTGGGKTALKTTDYELNPATAALWVADDDVEAADHAVEDTNAKWTQAKKDLDNLVGFEGSADGKTPSSLGTRDEIDAEVAAADKAVSDAEALVRKRLSDPCASVRPGDPDSLALGAALQRQSTASTRAAAFDAAKALVEAERDQAAGKPVDATALEALRTAATATADAYDAANGDTPTPREEQSLRTLQTKAGKDFAAQGEVVAKAQTALGGARSGAATRHAKTSLAGAEAELAKRDLAKRGIDVQLAVLDASRAALAAQAEYRMTRFVQPHDEMYVADGKGVTNKVYPVDYDPTWNITPDHVPEGAAAPRQEHGGWTVEFEHDSDVLGVSGPMHGRYVIAAGTYRMNPAAAAIWQANADLDKAIGARRDYRSEVATLTTPTGSEAPFPSITTADGTSPTPIDFTDDLTARKADVDRSVDDATRMLARARKEQELGNGEPATLRTAVDDAQHDLDIVTAERETIAAVQAWQQANQVRLVVDADKSAGRPARVCHPQDPTDMATDLRVKAREARSTWLAKLNGGAVDDGQRAVDAAKQAHDAWKTEHPDRLASEFDTPTWKALQAAQAELARAKVSQVTMANVAARDANADLVATLGPDQQRDGRALSELFMKSPENAKALARSTINESFAKTGGLPVRMSGRTELSNNVAFALGWHPSGLFDADSPYAADQVRNEDLFEGLPRAQQEMRTAVSARIAHLGGDNARVTVVPVIYAIGGDDGGIVQTAIFKVETKGGGIQYVDEQAHTYDDVDDYRANNDLPVTGSNLVMPKDGDFTLDSNGNVELFTGAARTETFTEEVRRRLKLDVVIGIAGLMAGVAMTVGSFGVLSVPGAVLVTASAYGIASSADSLRKQADHGIDVNPFTNTQARMDWANLGLSALNVPVLGSSVRAIRFARLADAAKDAGETALAKTWITQAKRAALPAEVLSDPIAVGNVAAFGEGAYHVGEDWDRMTPAEQRRSVGMLALNAAGFATPLFAKVDVEAHSAGGSAAQRSLGRNGATGHGRDDPTPVSGDPDVAGNPTPGPSTVVDPASGSAPEVDPANARPAVTEPTTPVVGETGDPGVLRQLTAMSSNVSRNPALAAIAGGETAGGRPTTARGPDAASPATDAASLQDPFESTRNPHASTLRQRATSALTPFRPPWRVSGLSRRFTREVAELIERSPTLQALVARAVGAGYDFRMGRPGKGSSTDRARRVITLDPDKVRTPAAYARYLTHELDHVSRTERMALADEAGSSTRTAPDVLGAEGEARMAEIAVAMEILENGGPDIAGITSRERAIHGDVLAGSSTVDEGVARLARSYAHVRESTSPMTYGERAADGSDNEAVLAFPEPNEPATVVLASQWNALETLLRSGRLTMQGPARVMHLQGADPYDFDTGAEWLGKATHVDGDEIALTHGKRDWTGGPDPQALTDRDVFLVSRETYGALKATDYEGIALGIDRPYDLRLPGPKVADERNVRVSLTIVGTSGVGAAIARVLYVYRDTALAAIQPGLLIAGAAYRLGSGIYVTSVQGTFSMHVKAVRGAFNELDKVRGWSVDEEFERKRQGTIQDRLKKLEWWLVKHPNWTGIRPELKGTYEYALRTLRNGAASLDDRNLAIDILAEAEQTLMAPTTRAHSIDSAMHVVTLSFSNGAILEGFATHPGSVDLSTAAGVLFLVSNVVNSTRRLVVIPIARRPREAFVGDHSFVTPGKKTSGWLDTFGYIAVAADAFSAGHPMVGALAGATTFVAGYKAAHNHEWKWLEDDRARKGLIVAGPAAAATTLLYLWAKFSEDDDADGTRTSVVPTQTLPPQAPTTQPSPTRPSPTPTAPPTTKPTKPTKSNKVPEPDEPHHPVKKDKSDKTNEPLRAPRAVRVAAGNRATSTLWGIADANASALLTKHEIDSARKRGGHDAVVLSAFKELLQLNPRFRPELLDGVPTSKRGDPDTIQPGGAIVVERR